MLLYICCVIFVVGFLVLNSKNYRNKHKLLLEFPGPKPLPFLGNVLQFIVPAAGKLSVGTTNKILLFKHLTDTAMKSKCDFANLGLPAAINDLFKRNFQKYGKLWTLWVFSKPTLMTSDQKLAQKVLGSYSHLEKHFMYNYGVKIVLGNNGLITSPVHQWKTERKILNKLFNVQYFEASFNQCLDIWGDLKTAIMLHEESPVDSLVLFRRFYLKIMLQSFNVDSKFYMDDAMSTIEEQFNRGLRLINTRLMKPWTRNCLYWKLFGYQKELESLHTVLREYFKCQIESYSKEENGFKKEVSRTYETVKGFLMDPTIPFDVKYDHVITIIAAAVDTSAIAVTMTLFFLANNPNRQKKVQKEIDDLLDEYKSLQETKLSDFSKLKYLRQCFKEALRLHPPVPAIGRTTTEDIILEDGKKIPTGTGIMFLLREIHMNPEIFPNPEKFYPERFNDKKCTSQSCNFLPFSYGPRNCIGQKYSEGIILAMLLQILRHFSVKTLQKPKQIKILYEIAGTPSPNVKLIFEKRNLCKTNSKESQQSCNT